VPRKASSASRAAAPRTTDKPARGGKIRERSDSKAAPKIRFSATLLRPARGEAVTTGESKSVSRGSGEAGGVGGWTFLNLPKEASAKLPSRGMVSVEGTLNGSLFRATLEPDGQGGHWLKVNRTLREEASAEAGDIVTLEIVPLPIADEPEPEVPPDLRKALASAPGAGGAKAREAWSDITPIARRDWIQWITSGKRAETRVKRIAAACDMLAKGKRRPCCFDRSGMYGKSMSCPVAEDADKRM
jgi:hypothetical protein